MDNAKRPDVVFQASAGSTVIRWWRSAEKSGFGHWAHFGRRTCDPWWENETEWHRAWKGHFPDDWQEVVHQAKNGEKHIADVKTDQGWALEFQHTYLKPEERRAREAFYPKLVWVVNGTRRKRDIPQFFRALKEEGVRVSEKPLILRLRGFLDECALLRDWAGSHAPQYLARRRRWRSPRRF